MPSLAQLVTNLPNFNYYYGGLGNFTTNRIPYGDDRPGGGWSGQPYIVRAPGEQWSPNNADDGLIRFGAIGVTERTTADLLRITKFFADPVKGQQFILKQVGLQLSNPQLEQRVGSTMPDAGPTLLSQVTSLPSRIQADIGPTRVFNLGINTLAQIGVEAAGGHFYRNGLSPVMDDNDKYLAIVRDNNNINTDSVNPDSGNRLVGLTYKMFGDDRTLFSYKMGPDSVYGIGQTSINSFTDTLSDSHNAPDFSSFIPLKPSDLAKIGRDGVLLQSSPDPNNPNTPVLTSNAFVDNNGQVSYDLTTMDFRQIKNALYNVNLPYTDYTSLNLDNRIGRGNPGTPGLDRSVPSNVLPGTQDRINQLSLFYAKDPPQANSTITDLNSGLPVTQASIRDMIRFRIESIDNDNPMYSIWMVFRAFIQGDIDDSFSAEWNSYKYTGRGERFYAYDG